MRHQKKRHKLGRARAHRKATLAALSTALIEHKRITTTVTRAKALRVYVEPLINRAKEDSTHNRREVFRRLQSKQAVTELFSEVATKIGDRPGGFTRVVKLGRRAGDAAEMAVIELVDYNDVKPEGASTGKKKTRRSRRSKSSDAPAQKPKAAAKTPKTEANADDLTKVWGVGPVFAGALKDAGITTYDALARADLDALRAAIAAGSDASDAAANEETWAEQAAFLAKGDQEGHDAYVEKLKSGDEPTEAEADAPAATEAEASDEPTAEDASTQSDDAPEAPANDETIHPDTPQGETTGTGEPPPEGGKGVSGGSQHRG